MNFKKNLLYKKYSTVLIRVERAPDELPNHPRHIHPPMDLKYIQSGLKAKFDKLPLLIDGWLLNSTTNELIRNVLSLNADIAVIRTNSPCIEESMEIGRELRSKGLFVIGVNRQGGFDSLFNDCFDIFLSGEPEKIVPEIVEFFIKSLNVQKNKCDGSSFGLKNSFNLAVEETKNMFSDKEDYLVENPDKLAFPIFNRDELNFYTFPFPLASGLYKKWGYVLATWGCPHNCFHCSGVVRKTHGKKYRKRSVKLVVNEIEALIDLGAEGIIFEDDSLFTDSDYIQKLCDEIVLRQLHFPWIAHARADHLINENVRSAARAGAVLLKVGVESGSDRIIEKIGKSPDGKEWIEKVKKGFSYLKKYKVGGVALFLVGAPDESIRDLLKSFALARKISPDYIQVQIFCLYHDTILYKRLHNNHALLNNLYHYSNQTDTNSNLSAQKLQKYQLIFYKMFYFRLSYILDHAIRYFWFYIKTASLKRIFLIVKWLLKSTG